MPRAGGRAPTPLQQRAPGPGGEEISLREAEQVLGRAPLWAGSERPVVARTEGGVTLEGREALISQGDARMLPWWACAATRRRRARS